MKNKYLFFSPYAGISKHSEVEDKLALGLKSMGNEVSFLRCDGEFSNYCLTMSAYGMQISSEIWEKEKVCIRCKSSANFSKEYLKIDATNIFERISPIGYKELEFLTNENWINFKYKGLDVGRIAAYQVFIKYKLNSNTIPKHAWPLFVNDLRQCIALIDQYEEYFKGKSDLILVVYNRLYPLNHVMCILAEHAGLDTYSIQASGALDNFYDGLAINRHELNDFDFPTSEEWKDFSRNSLLKSEVKDVIRHIKALFVAKSPWVYSPPRKVARTSLRGELGIDVSKRLILLTMSSEDELVAASMSGLIRNLDNLRSDSQIEWVTTVIGSVSNADDIHLIVRPHPREFPNKRDDVTSPQSILLRGVFEELPPNVSVDWPTDNRSIYDYVGEVDLLVNYSSSVGAEFALFGVPVLLHNVDNLFVYPVELNFLRNKSRDYLEEIKRDFTLDEITNQQRLAFRWFYFKYKVAVSTEVSRILPFPSRLLFVTKRIKLKFSWFPVKIICRLQLTILRARSSFSRIHEVFFILLNRLDSPMSIDRKFELNDRNESQELKFITTELKRLMAREFLKK
jgi:hypothetical protein